MDTSTSVGTILVVLAVARTVIGGDDRMQAAHSSPYVGIDLGTLGGDSSEAHALNSRGQIVGFAMIPGNIPRAFLWEKGVMTDLGTFDGFQSMAEDVNDSGQVVGASTVDGQHHACMWESRRLRDLHPTWAEPNSSSWANGINNRGQVVGHTVSPYGRPQPWMWENGVSTHLGLPGPGAALAINDRGQVVGYYESDLGRTCGFRWEGGVFVSVGPCQANTSTSLRSINNKGQVIGQSLSYFGLQSFGPFLFDMESYTQLDNVIPTDINESGDVACAHFSQACIWEKGVVSDVDAQFGTAARAINNRSDLAGLVTLSGSDYRTHAYLWNRVH